MIPHYPDSGKKYEVYEEYIQKPHWGWTLMNCMTAALNLALLNTFFHMSFLKDQPPCTFWLVFLFNMICSYSVFIFLFIHGYDGTEGPTND